MTSQRPRVSIKGGKKSLAPERKRIPSHRKSSNPTGSHAARRAPDCSSTRRSTFFRLAHTQMKSRTVPELVKSCTFSGTQTILSSPDTPVVAASADRFNTAAMGQQQLFPRSALSSRTPPPEKWSGARPTARMKRPPRSQKPRVT